MVDLWGCSYIYTYSVNFANYYLIKSQYSVLQLVEQTTNSLATELRNEEIKNALGYLDIIKIGTVNDYAVRGYIRPWNGDKSHQPVVTIILRGTRTTIIQYI